MDRKVKISQLLELQLTMLLEGRPFSILHRAGEEIVQLDHENGRHHVTVPLGMLTPVEGDEAKKCAAAAIKHLDAMAFPDRQKKVYAAVKELPNLLMEKVA